MKLIIDIPDNEYEYTCERTLSDRTFWDDAIRKGTPLDDVKKEIETAIEHTPTDNDFAICKRAGLTTALEILDNIGKESEDNNESV